MRSFDPRDQGDPVVVIEQGVRHVSGDTVKVRLLDGTEVYRLARYVRPS